MDRFPSAGPPRALGHLRGHEPPRPRQECRRRGRARQALRRAPRPAHRARPAPRGHQAAGAHAPGLHRSLPAPALPDRPRHPGRLRPAHAAGVEPARGRRQPHHHQARAAAPHQPGGEPGRQGGRGAGADRSDLRSRRRQHRQRRARQDQRDLGADRSPAGAGGRQGHLLAPVRAEHPSHRREHRGGPPSGGRGRLAARGGQGSAPRARRWAPGAARGRRLPHPHAHRGRLGEDAHGDHGQAGRRAPDPRRGADRVLADAAVAQLPRHQGLQGGPGAPRTRARRRGPAVPPPPGGRCQGVRRAHDGAAGAQPAGEEERLLGRPARRRHRSGDGGEVPLLRDDPAEGTRRQDGGQGQAPHGGEGAPPPAHGRAAAALQGRVPLGRRLLPGQRPEPERQGCRGRPVGGGHPGGGAARRLRSLQGCGGAGGEEGYRRARHLREPARPDAGLLRARAPADGARADRVPDRRRGPSPR